MHATSHTELPEALCTHHVTPQILVQTTSDIHTHVHVRSRLHEYPKSSSHGRPGFV